MISRFIPGWRAEPRVHVTQSLADDWLSEREREREGWPPRKRRFLGGLREGPGSAKRGWALRVMAVPCSRVHLYRSLGPVTKESRRCRCSLPPVGPGASGIHCHSPTSLLWEALGGRGRGGILRAGNVCEGREQPLEPGSERADWGRGRLRAGVWERVTPGRAWEAAGTFSAEARAGGA